MIFDIFSSRKLKVTAEPSIIRSSIECGVKVVRENACDCVRSVQAQKKPIDDVISTGIEHSQCTIHLHCVNLIYYEKRSKNFKSFLCDSYF